MFSTSVGGRGKALLLMVVLWLLEMLSCAKSQAASNQQLPSITKTFSLVSQQGDFQCVLSANRTTGFRWFLVNHSQAVQPIKQQYITAFPVSRRLGAGGRSVWYFHCRKGACIVPRVIELTFWYMRPWEGIVAQERKIRVLIAPPG